MSHIGRRHFVSARAIRSIEIGGLVSLLVSFLWWAVVYTQVMNNTGFPIGRTLPCLLYTSDRCSLAMALCKDWHFLGIKRYSAGLIWSSVGLIVLALVLGHLRPDHIGPPDQSRRA